MESTFKYEDCLLKHHIRYNSWLPLCKMKLAEIREVYANKKIKRRLKYFTFCAVGAIDVHMLLLERVLKLKDDRFDTVYFFEERQEDVLRTQESIPGATGFAGDFLEVVLAHGADAAIVDVPDPLDYRTRKKETIAQARKHKVDWNHKQFVECFPFDVMNLDLETFLFKPKDPIPGRLINAIGNLLEWQKRPVRGGNAGEILNGFGLMFTTRIGPKNLTPEYRKMLVDCLGANISVDPKIADHLRARVGISDPQELWDKDFDVFFKVAMPKMLAAEIHARDWFIDPEDGWHHFEFSRDGGPEPYKMLHLVFNVRRQDPPVTKRSRFGKPPQKAQAAYERIVTEIAANDAIVLTDSTIAKKELRDHLERIKQQRELLRSHGAKTE